MRKDGVKVRGIGRIICPVYANTWLDIKTSSRLSAEFFRTPSCRGQWEAMVGLFLQQKRLL